VAARANWRVRSDAPEAVFDDEQVGVLGEARQLA